MVERTRSLGSGCRGGARSALGSLDASFSARWSSISSPVRLEDVRWATASTSGLEQARAAHDARDAQRLRAAPAPSASHSAQPSCFRVHQTRNAGSAALRSPLVARPGRSPRSRRARRRRLYDHSSCRTPSPTTTSDAPRGAFRALQHPSRPLRRAYTLPSRAHFRDRAACSACNAPVLRARGRVDKARGCGTSRVGDGNERRPKWGRTRAC